MGSFLKSVSFVALFAVALSSPMDDHKKKAEKVMETCLAEAQLPPDAPLPELKSDSPKKVQCLVKCLLEGMYNQSISNLDGLFSNYEKAMRAVGKIDKETLGKAQDVFNKCKNQEATDDCEKAAKLTLCIGETSKKDGMKGASLF